MVGPPTVDVEIKLVGVREGRIDRLKTMLLTHLVQFGSKIQVKVDGEKRKLSPREK